MLGFTTANKAGDTIQLQVTSDTDSDEVVIEHFSTTIAKFFRGDTS